MIVFIRKWSSPSYNQHLAATGKRMLDDDYKSSNFLPLPLLLASHEQFNPPFGASLLSSAMHLQFHLSQGWAWRKSKRDSKRFV